VATRRRGNGRRWIVPSQHARVHCAGGRWGPRRVRTNECCGVLKAEDWYTTLLDDKGGVLKPGSRGGGTLTFRGREHTAQWEVRSNAVWRRGRLFFVCGQCSSRCTRLYLPLESSWLACGKCWGLTYASRTLQNYKSTPWGGGRFAALFGITQRDWALMTTGENRERRQAASQERWRLRRVQREKS
jgi:hypothetical protein